MVRSLGRELYLWDVAGFARIARDEREHEPETVAQSASQTAWAVMGLLAFDDLNRESVKRGIEYLIRTQNEEGSWTELETTGTGFPKVFYLKYDIYRNSWPLLALATYKNLLKRSAPESSVNGKHHDLPEVAMK